MKRLLSFLFQGLLYTALSAQVVTTEPALPTEGAEVTVTFHADRGAAGLKDYSGDVYAHTGVVTGESSTDSDWKYVVSDWGGNLAKTKLERTDANTFTFTITPDIRSYYGVPGEKEILKMAFVFRSGQPVNGSYLEGKAEGGADIFVMVYEAGLKAVISSPENNLLFDPGQTIVVEGQGQQSDSLKLFLDGAEVQKSTSADLSYELPAPAKGTHQLILKAYGNGGPVADTVDFFIIEPVVSETMPAGLRKGVNIIDDNTATLVLPAPYKSFVYVLGDFNNWQPRPEVQMKKDGEMFWLTISGLQPGEEYAYQYYIDGEIKVADPYANKVLDPWNDQYIPERIYPDLKPYPSEEAVEGIVSVFTTTPGQYQWQTSVFTPPDPEDLVIYELLIRDFTANQDIKTVTDTLDYLQQLGINAIELMPFNEFEGNDSWGYNPSFYFAADKAYGTLNDYKAFVDTCHSKGIAVIMDLVLNHSYGQSPLVQMYFNDGKPAANNPWYNREYNMANPDAQWGYDFNHESSYTQALVDSINAYWMKELHIDGFRFDFTKGFTNTPYDSDSWASDYDASRIRILTRMADQIWKRNPDAYVIFEHLADNSEEKDLANHGILLWGNMNYAFCEAVMGYNEDGKSDFSWASYKKREWNSPNLVTYMESHDEERIMYKALSYGNSTSSYNVAELENAVLRSAMASVFFMSVPGPKMIWQFGEMGYDMSIDEGGRLSQKPPKWDYLDNYARKALWDFYANVVSLKKNQPVFHTADFTLDVSGAQKRIMLNSDDVTVRLVGNFDVETATVVPQFNRAGWWYNHFHGDSIQVIDPDMKISLRPGEFAFYTSKKLEGFSNVTSTGPDVFDNPNSPLVFPNPIDGQLNIDVSADQKISKIVIYDFSGRVVFKKNAISRRRFNVSSLPRGVYFLEIVPVQGRSAWQKIMKR
jgi:1,4-alpha-glucan branching enzyme